MTDTLDAEIVVQIRAEMLRQHLTMDDLAQRLDLPLGTLRARLATPRGLVIGHLSKIADALGMDLADLVARAERTAA